MERARSHQAMSLTFTLSLHIGLHALREVSQANHPTNCLPHAIASKRDYFAESDADRSSESVCRV